jgi:hypothetical protein
MIQGPYNINSEVKLVTFAKNFLIILVVVCQLILAVSNRKGTNSLIVSSRKFNSPLEDYNFLCNMRGRQGALRFGRCIAVPSVDLRRLLHTHIRRKISQKKEQFTYVTDV